MRARTPTAVSTNRLVSISDLGCYLLLLGLPGRGADRIAVCVFFVDDAVVLANFPFRFQVVLLWFIDPRLGIGLWVINRYCDLQSLGIDAPVSFGEVHRIAVRIAVEIQPGYIVEADRIDDKCVSLPSSDRISHPGWIRIVRKFSSVGPDRAPMPIVFEEHDDPAWHLNN